MSLWTKIKAAFRPRPEQHRTFVSFSQAGVLVTEDTAMTFSVFWACVRVISQTVASLPWGVYQRTDNGRREIDGELAWLLNNRPNPDMTAFAFREAMIAHALVWGNAYAEITFNMAMRPTGLWLIAPDRVNVERDWNNGELVYRVTGDDGSQTLLPSSRILHVHGLGFDGIVGYSTARMAARAIGVGIAQETFAQSFYANGAVFGTMVEMPVKNMSVEQIAAAEASLNDKARGPSKAFSTKVVPEGTKPHALTMPLQDAQFLESRKFSVSEICRWFGVPPHKVADLDRSTNNNIEHQGIEFVTDAIIPWVTRFEQEANVKLIAFRSQGRVYTKINVSGLMRGDSKARAEYYRTMVNLGVMTINEVRALEEMNGIGEAGDAHLVQLNQTTVERIIDGISDEPEPVPEPEPISEPEPNVIRTAALAWAREQRKAS